VKRSQEDIDDDNVLRAFWRANPGAHSAAQHRTSRERAFYVSVPPDPLIAEAMRRYPIDHAGGDWLSVDVNQAPRDAWLGPRLRARSSKAAVATRRQERIASLRAGGLGWSRLDAAGYTLAKCGVPTLGALLALYYLTSPVNLLLVAPFALVYVLVMTLGAFVSSEPMD